jgi:hypothetical protein
MLQARKAGEGLHRTNNEASIYPDNRPYIILVNNVLKEQDVLERRMNVIVRGVEEIDSEWKAEGFMKKAYDMEQVALIAHAKAPEYAWQEYKEAIQKCVRLGKDPTHSKRPMKVVFKQGHEKMRDGLIGGSLHLSLVNKEQGTVFRIQEDLTASKHKLYTDAWEAAGQRSRSGKGEEWTVVGPKSKPRLKPKKILEEGKGVSKEERKEAEQEKFNNFPKKVLQNGMAQRMVERVHKIQDAEDAEQEERDAAGDQG